MSNENNNDEFDFFKQLDEIQFTNVASVEIEELPKASIEIFDSSTQKELSTIDNKSNVSNLEDNDFIKNIFEEKVSTIEDDIDADLYDLCKDEAKEMLENVDSIMDNVETDTLDLEQNTELKRYLHTFKGSVKMAGANRSGALAHRLESLLDYSENHKLSLFSMKSLLEDEIDKIKYLVENPYETLSREKNAWLDNTKLGADNFVVVNTDNNLVVALNDNIKSEQKVIKKDKEDKQYIRIVSGLVDQLINEAGEIRLTRNTLEGMVTGNKKSLTELKSSSEKLAKMLKEVEIQAESQIQAGKDKIGDDGSFDPLEFDRFTRLQELTRFMHEAVADIQDTVIQMEGYLKTQDTSISQQALLTNNILDSLMNIRLVRVNSISDRLYTITRKTSKELSKRVNLELIGEQTEMDRLVLDKVMAPLEHLLRNCIAHGIESPEERIASGKSNIGNITFKTNVEGNFIVMVIKDDGAGINLNKVKQIGLKKNLIKANVSYSDKEIIDLIFQPGFSTADTVSQVSGRGVGMEIVKNDITALGGSISTETVVGFGTTFTIILPVAMATNHAMLTENMGKLVAIPALLVSEVISLKQLKLEEAYKNGYITHRNKQLPLVYMGHLIGALPPYKNPEIKTYNTLIAVSYLDQILVVHVDKLRTTSEVLIKSVGGYLNKISGVLGATLLGDGQQGTVVNPILLKGHYDKNVKDRDMKIGNNETRVVTDTITVMVVDDSITVRRATTKLLERKNFNVILGKDGEDALEQLQLAIPDIILSDIEMPRMDGFEFAKNIRNTEKYAHIPIIMISSRTADKHKNYAYSLGVDAFLGKPYQEDELIDKINELLSKNK